MTQYGAEITRKPAIETYSVLLAPRHAQPMPRGTEELPIPLLRGNTHQRVVYEAAA